MKLPIPPGKYDPSLEAQRNSILEQADSQSHKKTTDLEIVLPQRLILRSPDGSRWVVSVDNAGTLVITAL